jgi:hypothetical protein
MKRKHLFLAIAVLLTAGGLWLARTTGRTHARDESSTGVGVNTSRGGPQPGQMLNSPGRFAPPNPNRKFEKLTPEERVQLARRGPIGG